MTKYPEDRELTKWVSQAQDGDEASLGLIIESIQKDLFRFCLYLCRDSQQAEDLCQESLVQALQKIHKLKDASAFKSWLFKSAKNLHLDLIRAQKHRTYEALEEASEPIAETPNPDNLLEIRRSLAELDPEARAVLILIDSEGFSYTEASKILDISESALTSRLYRAREAFLKKFGQGERK